MVFIKYQLATPREELSLDIGGKSLSLHPGDKLRMLDSRTVRTFGGEPVQHVQVYSVRHGRTVWLRPSHIELNTRWGAA